MCVCFNTLASLLLSYPFLLTTPLPPPKMGGAATLSTLPLHRRARHRQHSRRAPFCRLEILSRRSRAPVLHVPRMASMPPYVFCVSLLVCCTGLRRVIVRSCRFSFSHNSKHQSHTHHAHTHNAGTIDTHACALEHASAAPHMRATPQHVCVCVFIYPHQTLRSIRQGWWRRLEAASVTGRGRKCFHLDGPFPPARLLKIRRMFGGVVGIF